MRHSAAQLGQRRANRLEEPHLGSDLFGLIATGGESECLRKLEDGLDEALAPVLLRKYVFLGLG